MLVIAILVLIAAIIGWALGAISRWRRARDVLMSIGAWNRATGR